MTAAGSYLTSPTVTAAADAERVTVHIADDRPGAAGVSLTLTRAELLGLADLIDRVRSEEDTVLEREES